MKFLLNPIKEFLSGILMVGLMIIWVALPIAGTYLLLRWTGIL